MKLTKIIENTSIKSEYDGEVEIESVVYDSRKVQEGSLFIAVKGLVSDGHDYIPQVIESKAAAVLIDNNKYNDFKNKYPETIFVSAKNTRFALSEVSAFFYGEVSKKIPVIGITGTNGKTSTTYMLESIFKEAGRNPGVMGTINYRWKNTVKNAPNTTPESLDIHNLMKEMYDDGVDVIIMEVSSHGLDLGRVDDIDFEGAVFTNLTQDHLDYHKSFEEYYLAKRKLFDLLEKSSREKKFAVINTDGEWGLKLKKYCHDLNFPSYSYSGKEGADFSPVDSFTKVTIDGVSFKLNKMSESISMNMAGYFSLYNAVAASAAALLSGVEQSFVRKGLENLKTVPGRFDRIKSKLGFGVIVDYAHTDDALVKLLESAGDVTENKLITVFGCGGDRDRKKRPLMGRAACSMSDIAIVTSDNPRTEDPLSIIKDIEEGIADYKDIYTVISDREQAIEKAVSIASDGDVIVIAGKGHEDYQIIGKDKIHFDDKEIAHKYIDLREKNES